MARVTIIDGHPDPAREHFVHALADAYAEGAETRHEVMRVEVGALDFPLLRSPKAWREDEPPPAIAAAQEVIAWAEHLVFAYPLWLGDVPALFKGFLEQVARPGFAMGRMGKGFPERLLLGRSARVIVTMGMPAAFYQLFYRAHSLKSLERNILAFSGVAPIRHSIIGSVDKSAAHRRKWLNSIRELGVVAS
jgi:putative NADPH-quinone reductase